MLTLHDKNAVSTQMHLGSKGKNMRQRVVSQTLKTFQCSELRESRTMSLNRLYIEYGCTNLWIPIFTDPSEETMYIMVYLQDDELLKLTNVIRKCCVAPIRHTTVRNLEFQAAECGVPIRRQILTKLTKSIFGLIDLKSYSGYSQLTRNSKCLLPTGLQKYWKTLPGINGDMSKESKTQQILAQDWCPSEASRNP